MYCPFKNLLCVGDHPQRPMETTTTWASLGMGRTGWEVGGAWCALYNC
jgi:hypothetical protein